MSGGETRKIEQAMVLAAGRGKRMRELTDARPKPLVEVQGRAMIDHVLDRLGDAGVTRAVVNHSYLGDRIVSHLAGREAPEIVLSEEPDALETGGGVLKAIDNFGDQPFYVVNGDVVWLDGLCPALSRLAASWDDEQMDVLLLLHPAAFALGYNGRGDFLMTPDGQLRRRMEREVAPFVFAGVQVLHPRLFVDCPEGAFSLNLLYDRAAAAERLWGLRHDGEWFHIGTPEALDEVEHALHHLTSISVHR